MPAPARTRRRPWRWRNRWASGAAWRSVWSSSGRWRRPRSRGSGRRGCTERRRPFGRRSAYPRPGCGSLRCAATTTARSLRRALSWGRTPLRRRGRWAERCRWRTPSPWRWRSPRMADLATGTVTFLFTDIEGSTQLWEQHPDAMRLALARHDTCLNAAIESNGGHIFKTGGDAFCAAFATAPDALDAALAAQQTLRALQPSAVATAAGLALKVRIALHTGAAEARGGDYFGPALNRIARLLAIGHGGQVLLSQTTADPVHEELPPHASLRPLGSHRLPDLQRPEQVYQLLHPELPADFPPLKSLDALPNNLPRQLTRFIGREQAIVEVKRLLASSALLTLTGSGGCGKSRLALQVGADLLEEYADGVWLVELAALSDPALVPQTVATALGVRELPGRPLIQTLIDALHPKQLLLLLDNCEHLLSACTHLTQSLLQACPQVRGMGGSRGAPGVVGGTSFGVGWLYRHDAKA